MAARRVVISTTGTHSFEALGIEAGVSCRLPAPAIAAGGQAGDLGLQQGGFFPAPGLAHHVEAEQLPGIGSASTVVIALVLVGGI